MLCFKYNVHVYYCAVYTFHYIVTGDANFDMSKISLTVGWFNQPLFSRQLIEQPGSAEKGFTQRFLWMFPKPVYGRFDSLEPTNNGFSESIGMFVDTYIVLREFG